MKGEVTVGLIILELVCLILFGVFVRYDETGNPNDFIKKNEQATINPNATTTSPKVTTTTKPTVSIANINDTMGDSNGTSSSTKAMTTSTKMMASISPPSKEESHEKTLEDPNVHVNHFYPMFQDIHTMMFIGFGFLMTFLKRYGFSSVGVNFLVAAYVLQWAVLTGGWIRHYHSDNNTIYVNVAYLIDSDFAAAAVLISFGAVLGKASVLQVMVMATIEVVLFQVNELIVFDKFAATDIGDSMVVHIFGAYFGLAVAWMIYKKDVHDAEEKEGSVYHSDLFAMIGTVFLWLFWPSFNAAAAADEGRVRAIVNTYFSLAACTVVTFAMSYLVEKSKFNMVHVQNSTLAGGVAIGTLADLIIQPWAAILVGSVAGVISVLGYKYLTPLLYRKLHLHDTCGVHNLHGMPGILSGIGGIIAAGVATEQRYGDSLGKVFTERIGDNPRTVGEQAGYQAAGLVVSFAIALVGGLITGLILRLPFWGQPKAEEIFEDELNWMMPPDASLQIRNSPNHFEAEPVTEHHRQPAALDTKA